MCEKQKIKDGGVDFAQVILYAGHHVITVAQDIEKTPDNGFAVGRHEVLDFFCKIIKKTTVQEEVSKKLLAGFKNTFEKKKDFEHKPGIDEKSIQERQNLAGKMFEFETLLRGMDSFPKK